MACMPAALDPPVAIIMPMRSTIGLRPGANLGRKKMNVVAAHTTTKNSRTRLTTYAALTLDLPPPKRTPPLAFERRCLQSAHHDPAGVPVLPRFAGQVAIVTGGAMGIG